MTTKIYLNANNSCVFENVNFTDVIPAGSMFMRKEGNMIRFSYCSDGGLYLNTALADIHTSTGVSYADYESLVIALSNFFVDAAQVAADSLNVRLTYVEQHAYDTLWIDYWQTDQPSTPFVGQVWFNTTDTVKAWDGTLWNTIPISFYKLYVKASAPTREIYSWSGSTMVAISVPLTRASIEAIMGDRTVAVSAYNIDLNTGEKFTKTCGSASAFTITNPILDKAFRLVITGGTLATTLFTGYTSNWLLGAVITDYTPANTNYLWCEIRSTGQIYLFWGE